MRILRIGAAGTKTGKNVHAALVSWRRGEQVRGGIALVAASPSERHRPVDAIVVLPRGLLVVVGVDLPDPAKRLEAPLDGPWLADGWPLVNETDPEAVNPARQALRTASAAVRSLRALLGEPLTSCAVLAVGPYAGEIVTPPSDLARGVRVLFPEHASLRAAADQLAGKAFTFDQVRTVLGALAPEHPELTDAALREEGFAERPEPGTGGSGEQPHNDQRHHSRIDLPGGTPVPTPRPTSTPSPWWRRKP